MVPRVDHLDLPSQLNQAATRSRILSLKVFPQRCRSIQTRTATVPTYRANAGDYRNCFPYESSEWAASSVAEPRGDVNRTYAIDQALRNWAEPKNANVSSEDRP